MTARGFRRTAAGALCIGVVASGCSWGGLNSLPLPGAPGRVPGAQVLHVQIVNVGSLESNSPVLIDDVVVGSVGAMKVRDWNADVEVFVRPGVAVPANAVATVGQTSLLGSSHLALDPPVGSAPSGQLTSGASIPLDRSSTYPSTEQTLSSLSVVLNAGGLGQIGDIITNMNRALGGRETVFRDLLERLDRFMATLAEERTSVAATIEAMNRLVEKFADQRDVLANALRRLPGALRVLQAQRQNLTTALDRLRVFSGTATTLVNDVKDDAVANLKNLEPTLDALAKVGSPALGKGLQSATVFPFSQYVVDDALRGDYMNLFATLDLTNPRFKRDLFYGTRWGDTPDDRPPPEGNPKPVFVDPFEALIPPVAGEAPPADAPGAGP